eukprot:361984-Chlamydomonas_euryale.AAC.1
MPDPDGAEFVHNDNSSIEPMSESFKNTSRGYGQLAFLATWSKFGRPATIDAFATAADTTHCPVFHSKTRLFCEEKHPSNQHEWMAAPLHILPALLRHIATRRDSTTACVTGWIKIKTYAKGYPLWVDSNNVPRRVLNKSVEVYYDPPKPYLSALRMHVVEGPPEPMDMDGPTQQVGIMHLRGTIAGHAGKLAADTQASHNFIDADSVSRNNLATQPASVSATLANQSRQDIHATCAVTTRHPCNLRGVFVCRPTKRRGLRYKRSVTCYVLLLSSKQDRLLGQD